jgi:hypothetical protein
MGGFGEKTTRELGIQSLIERGRERLNATCLEAAIRIEQPGAHEAGGGKALEFGEQGGNGVWPQYRVGVEEQDGFTGDVLESQVIGATEAYVIGALDECYSREMGGEHFGASIEGTTIDDEYLRSEMGTGGLDGVKTRAEVIL